MTLEAAVKNQLALWPVFDNDERLFEVQEGSQHLACQMVALDRLACAFTRLAVSSESTGAREAAQLEETARRLAARLTYLLEPISPIEVDAHGCTVQMRSNPPQKGEDGTTYYELLVSRGGELSLCRYHRAQGTGRTLIACQVTREVFLRLVQDFASVG